MNKSALRPLLLSLKPEYAELIFAGLKTAELRRRLGLNLEQREVFVYVSTPTKQLRGGFHVGQVWSGPPRQIWQTVEEMAGVSRAEFNEYYQGKQVAFALEIQGVWEFARPIGLDQLRVKDPQFVVPQSYRYLRDQELAWIKRRVRRPRIAA